VLYQLSASLPLSLLKRNWCYCVMESKGRRGGGMKSRELTKRSVGTMNLFSSQNHNECYWYKISLIVDGLSREFFFDQREMQYKQIIERTTQGKFRVLRNLKRR